MGEELSRSGANMRGAIMAESYDGHGTHEGSYW